MMSTPALPPTLPEAHARIAALEGETDRLTALVGQLAARFQALVDGGGAAWPVGRAALGLVDRLFDTGHAAWDDPAARAGMAEAMAPIQAAFRTLLEDGTNNAGPKAAGLCRSLLKVWPALWTFVTVPGVEPTPATCRSACHRHGPGR